MGVRAETSFEVGLVGGAVDSVEDFGWGYFIPNNYENFFSLITMLKSIWIMLAIATYHDYEI